MSHTGSELVVPTLALNQLTRNTKTEMKRKSTGNLRSGSRLAWAWPAPGMVARVVRKYRWSCIIRPPYHPWARIVDLAVEILKRPNTHCLPKLSVNGTAWYSEGRCTQLSKKRRNKLRTTAAAIGSKYSKSLVCYRMKRSLGCMESESSGVPAIKPCGRSGFKTKDLMSR